MSAADVIAYPDVRLEVWGVPWPQGSKSAYVNKHTGRAVLAEGSKSGRVKHREWRRAVADAARDALDGNGGQPLPPKSPLEVVLRFAMPKPQSAPKKKRWVTTKPDLDKLIRSTLDGLVDGGLVAHDATVALLTASKRYAVDGTASGCTVEISVIEEPRL